MSIIESDIKVLVGLGLSGTQAKVCLSLASAETSTIREIALAAKVARPDTYRAVVELEHAGLLEKIISTPSKYKLLPLQEVISILTGRREATSLKLQNDAAKLLKEYEKKTKNEQPIDDNQFIVMPSGKAFLARLRKLVEKSKQKISIIADRRTIANFLFQNQDVLEAAFEKKIEIKILTEKQKRSRLSKKLFGISGNASLEIRYTNVLPPFTLVTFDSEEMVLSSNGQSGSYGSLVVCTSNTSLLELGSNFFNDAWALATEPYDLAFRRTKLQFDHLFANMINGFAYCKMIFNDENKPVDFVYLQINEAFEHITGLTRNLVIGKKVTKAIPGITAANPELFEIYGRVAIGGNPEDIEVFFKPLNCWLHISVYSPRKGYFAAVFEDITKRKKAEEMLSDSLAKYRALVENTDDAIVLTDLRGRHIFRNKAFYSSLGFEQNAEIELDGFLRVHPNDVQTVKDSMKSLFETGSSFIEYRVKRKDGTWINRQTKSTLILNQNKEPYAILAVMRDVTKIKEAESAIKTIDERYYNLVSNLEEGIWVIDPSAHTLFVNPRMAEMLGYTQQEMIGRHLFTFVKEDKREFIRQTMANRNAGFVGKSCYDFEFVHKDGSTKIFAVKTVVIVDSGGHKEYLGSFVDITDRKRAEEKLMESEERFRLMANNSPVILWVSNSNAEIIFINKTCEEFFGLELEGIYGKKWQSLVHGDDISSFLEIYLNATEEHKKFVAKARVKRADGEWRWIRSQGEPWFSSEGKFLGHVGVTIDITDQVRMSNRQETFIELLRLSNKTQSLRELVQAATSLFRRESGCDAVGIRLREGDDYPYYETRGFPPEHVLVENKLCARDEKGDLVKDCNGNSVIECMCGNIICGRFNPSLEFFTEKGSFWTNDITRLLATTSEADRQSPTRNRCNKEGYESVALIPLKVEVKTLGLLQINDKRKNMFSLKTIHFWEDLANCLSLAIARINAEEEVKNSEAKYRSLMENRFNQKQL